MQNCVRHTLRHLRQAELSQRPCAEASGCCICRRRSNTTRCTGGSACELSRGSTFRYADWPSWILLTLLFRITHSARSRRLLKHWYVCPDRCSQRLRQPTTWSWRLGSCTQTSVRRSPSLNLSRSPSLSPPLQLSQSQPPSPSRQRQARRRQSRTARRKCRMRSRQRLLPMQLTTL